MTTTRPTPLNRAAFAWRPVILVSVGVVALLVSFAGKYGYHCDELYFRMLGDHPAWGYPDQPPLTPLLAKAGVTMFGDSLWGIRVLPAAFTGVLAVLLAQIARETGGDAGAQTLAALGSLTLTPLLTGHTLVTVTPDLVVWLLVTLFAIRALLQDQPKYWLAVGVATGLGLYQKHLVILLLIGLGLGLLLVGPRSPLSSGWLLAGIAVAAVLGMPNLVYQVVEGFPQMAMARAVAERRGNRLEMIAMQPLLLGPLAAPIVVAGILALLRWPGLRPVRCVAVAYGVICVFLLATVGECYYTCGLLLPLYAVGCVAAVRWTHRVTGRTDRSSQSGMSRPDRLRTGLVIGAVTVNSCLSAAIALPLVPERDLGSTAIPDLNITIGNELGWPGYVRQVAEVYRDLPAADRAAAVVLAWDFGSAGAIDRYGHRYRLPEVYSGHNGLHAVGRPPESASVAVVVGEFDDRLLDGTFNRCQTRGRLESGTTVGNEVEGTPIRVCWAPRQPWSRLWARFRYVG
ncbi:MAG: hypothetical protein QG671_3612 [Actinomycetota bacterium]|nr:hypothetical protein [Actinomycetota bacterium]